MARVNEIKKIFSKFQMGSDYSVSSDNKTYIVSSKEMKDSFRGVFFNNSKWRGAFGDFKVEGRSHQSEFFTYQEGINDDPDLFSVKDGWNDEQERKLENIEKLTREAEKRNKEAAERNRKVRKQVEEGGSSLQTHSFHFRTQEGDKIVETTKILDNPMFEGNLLKDKSDSPKIREITDGKDSVGRKTLSQKELNENYKKVNDEKDLNEEQLNYIHKNEKDIKRSGNEGISSGVAIAVACGLAFVFAFGGIVWYKKKFSRK